MSIYTLSDIFIYPVKSCRGIRLNRSNLDNFGLEYDRAWLITDETGVALTQRDIPRMALIESAITEAGLCLNAPGMPELLLPFVDSAPADSISDVWGNSLQTTTEHEESTRYLSEFLGQSVRLVRRAKDYSREISAKPTPPIPNRHVHFGDSYPLLILSQASLDDLNARLNAPIPMDRFRPNLVIQGASPYAEDAWNVMKIGSVILRFGKLCSRCVMTTIKQDNAEKSTDGEPLSTLAHYRKTESGKVCFGMYAVHELTSDCLETGMSVEILEGKYLC